MISSPLFLSFFLSAFSWWLPCIQEGFEACDLSPSLALCIFLVISIQEGFEADEEEKVILVMPGSLYATSMNQSVCWLTNAGGVRGAKHTVPPSLAPYCFQFFFFFCFRFCLSLSVLFMNMKSVQFFAILNISTITLNCLLFCLIIFAKRKHAFRFQTMCSPTIVVVDHKSRKVMAPFLSLTHILDYKKCFKLGLFFFKNVLVLD